MNSLSSEVKLDTILSFKTYIEYFFIFVDQIIYFDSLFLHLSAKQVMLFKGYASFKAYKLYINKIINFFQNMTKLKSC